MELGLNLSFAVKRWTEPKRLAQMCAKDFGVKHIQFTWDLIDPWWPADKRALMAREYREAFEAQGLVIDATFGGLASYSYSQLLSPSVTEREIALEFLKRGVDLTSEMGAKVMGTPVGGMSYDDARDSQRRAFLYNEMLSSLRELADYAAGKGLKEIHIEATPLWTEFPHTPEVSIQLMKDLEGTAIPYKLLIDWGHAMFKPLLKEQADMALWLKECAPYVGSIHLQQTDGLWDRHWDFTAEAGVITPELIIKATNEAGLGSIVQYLEVVTIFEDEDDHVYEGIKKSMDFLHAALDA